MWAGATERSSADGRPDPSLTRRRSGHAAAALVALGLAAGCTPLLRGHGDVATGGTPFAARPALIMPNDAPSISRLFQSPARVTRGSPASHNGIDIVAETGTPVLASAPGTVLQVGAGALSGKRIVLSHESADGGRFQTWYFHLSERYVEAGEAVSRGQAIGAVGTTGLLAPFPHLHYELHRLAPAGDGLSREPVDPRYHWADGPDRVTCYDRRRDWSPARFVITYPLPCLDTPWR